LHLLSKTLIRLRKDKKCITPKTGKSMAQRLGRLCRDYNRMRSRRDKLWHSKQYDEYIHSQAWLDRASQHRRECEFRCQLCGRSGKLDVHHTPEGYKYLGREQCTHLIAVCRIPCHAIADFLRETKGNIESAD